MFRNPLKMPLNHTLDRSAIEQHSKVKSLPELGMNNLVFSLSCRGQCCLFTSYGPLSFPLNGGVISKRYFSSFCILQFGSTLCLAQIKPLRKCFCFLLLSLSLSLSLSLTHIHKYILFLLNRYS